MYCNVTEYPVLRYQWFHDDIMMREGQTYSIAVSKYNAHDGRYTCKAYNSAGYLQKYIDVDVKCKLQWLRQIVVMGQITIVFSEVPMHLLIKFLAMRCIPYCFFL